MENNVTRGRGRGTDARLGRLNLGTASRRPVRGLGLGERGGGGEAEDQEKALSRPGFDLKLVHRGTDVRLG